MSCSFDEPVGKIVKLDTWCRDYGVSNDVGERKENQDAVLGLTAPFNIFAVFDGHGRLGKLASERAKEIVKNSISQHSPPKTKEDSEEIIRTLLSEIDGELVAIGKDNNADFGTTASIAIPYGKDSVGGVVIGNVGDSDALVIKGPRELITLDALHRIRNNGSEQRRIEASGGKVWKSYAIPGSRYTNEEILKKGLSLAISRALGHFILKDYGISASPEFKDIPLSPGDSLIIASDGIWDVLNPKNVAKTVADNGDSSLVTLCQKICSDSLRAWNRRLTLADNMCIVIAQF